MKILMLISSLDIGGAETHVCELSKALISLGHSVCVVSASGSLVSDLGAADIKHICLPLNKKSPHSIFLSYLKLLHLTRKEGFDIIHAHSRIAAYIGERVSRKRHICFVTTVHASFSATPVKKYMSRWGYYVCAVSEDLFFYLRRNYDTDPDKIYIIPNGIDTSRFSPSKSGATMRSNDILFVSRLDSDCSDAAYSLCRIAKRLSEKHNGIRIRVIGGGDQYEALKIISEKVNKTIGYKCIEMLGTVKHPEKYMKTSILTVGVSRALLEAVSCGSLAILAGNEGFIGTLTRDNISLAEKSNFCGRGCESLTDEKLFSAIESIFSMSDADRTSLSRALMSYTEHEHSIIHSAKDTVELYNHTLDNVSFGKGKCCFCGYYGFGNTGDDVLLKEAIKRARNIYGKNEISALTAHPKKDIYKFGIPCISRNNIFKIYSEISCADTLVFGGARDATRAIAACHFKPLANTCDDLAVRIFFDLHNFALSLDFFVIIG